MKISKHKGHHPRFPVLRPAFIFDSIMGPILTHLRANNTTEIKALRRSANFVNNAVYQHVKARIPLISPPAPLEKVLACNDTISWLRTRYTKTSQKIGRSKFGYRG